MKNTISQKNHFYILCLFLFIFHQSAYSQLKVFNAVSDSDQASKLVNNIFKGSGLTVSNVTWFGGYADTLAQIGQFTVLPDARTDFGLDSGIIISNGNIFAAAGKQDYESNAGTRWYTMCEDSGHVNCQHRDTDLEHEVDTLNFRTVWPFCNACTYDAAKIEFDFIPNSSIINFRYMFASNEYPLYVCGPYIDVFGFFVTSLEDDGLNYNKKNIALIPGSNLPVCINTVNCWSPPDTTISPPIPPNHYDTVCKSLSHCKYYRNNTGDPYIAYNGMTTVLTASVNVIPCKRYHIKLAIADVGDDAYDSSFFLEANSLISPADNVKITYEHPDIDTNAASCCNYATMTIKLPRSQPKDTSINIVLSGSAVYGTDYTTYPPNLTSVTIPHDQLTGSFQIIPACSGIPPNAYVTINVETGCGGLTPFRINLINKPLLMVSTTNYDSICSGQKDIISVKTTGGFGQFSYQWSSNPSGFTSESVSPVVCPSVTTTYSVTVSDLCNGNNDTTVSFIINTIPLPATPIVTHVKDTLKSNYFHGNQWYFQNSILAGDTSWFIIPGNPGNYYVTCTQHGCQSPPSNIIIITGIDNLISKEYFNIYPNPVSNELIIETNSNSSYNISIIDIIGQVVYKSLFKNKAVINMSDLANGIYFLKLSNEEGILIRKVMKI